MNNAQLQIIISLIDNATSQLGDVASQLSDLASETADDAATMSESMATAATSMDTSVGTGAAAMTSSMADAVASITTDVGDLPGVFADDMASAQSEVEEAAAGMQGALSEAVAPEAISGLAGGLILKNFGEQVSGVADTAVDSAATIQENFANMANTVQNVFSSVGSSTSGASTEIAALQAKIASENSTVAEAQAALTKFSGTTAEVAAAHEKANTTIQTAEVNIQKYQQELDNLTNSQSLAGSTAAQVTAQFEAAANANVKLGFNVGDSATALIYLFSATQNVSQTMGAYQDAMDLSAKLNIPLSQAANDVVQAMNGQGRALRDLGINVADGLSGQTALAAIQEKVSGAAADAATKGLGPMNVAAAELNKTMSDFATDVLPLLQSFMTSLQGVIVSIDNFVQEHPKIAAAITIAIGAIGLILTTLGTLVLAFYTISLSYLALSSMFASAMPLLANPYVLAVLAIIAVITLIILYHKQIEEAIGAAWDWISSKVSSAVSAIGTFLSTGWNDIKTAASDVWSFLKELVSTAIDFIVGVIIIDLTALDPQWRAQWQAISDFVEKLWNDIKTFIGTAISSVANAIKGPINDLATWWHTTWQDFSDFFEKIWNGIESFVSGIINSIVGFFDQLGTAVAKAVAPLQPILGVLGSIGGLASTVGGAISSIIGTGSAATGLKAFASGGIVNSPTLALVGEAGPEAIIPLSAFAGGSSLAGAGGLGGAGGINVYIQGGNYLDQNGATMIANALAQQINRQLKLRNFV